MPSTGTYSAIDYYPFGMEMPKRIKGDTSYRFGFNGQMQDNEFAGKDGAHLEFEFREYDSRIGRFWKVDPLFKDYPWNSTYAFAENRPIDGMDLEGLEYVGKTTGFPSSGQKLAQDGTAFKYFPYIDAIEPVEKKTEARIYPTPSSYQKWFDATYTNDDIGVACTTNPVFKSVGAGFIGTAAVMVTCEAVGIVKNAVPYVYDLPVKTYVALNTTTAGAGVQIGGGMFYAGGRAICNAPPDMPEIPFPAAQIADVLTTYISTGIQYYNKAAQSNTQPCMTTPTATTNTAASTTSETSASAKNTSGKTSDDNKTNYYVPRNISIEP